MWQKIAPVLGIIVLIIILAMLGPVNTAHALKGVGAWLAEFFGALG